MPTKSLLTKPIEDMLSQAIAAELFAANQYLHLANQMQFAGYPGAQSFFLKEAEAEREHYQRLVQFVNDRGAWAKVPAVPAMAETASSIADALQVSYDTEVQLGDDYMGWYKECDCPITQQFLLFYLEEQRRSIGEFSDLIARLDRCGTDKCALILFDQELGA